MKPPCKVVGTFATIVDSSAALAALHLGTHSWNVLGALLQCSWNAPAALFTRLRL